jgi:UDP-N-acetylglucosamine diphosphorylase / glucose-1-phosphate thymidylyltransferase / UDP-N-acetylgalactosamine diphosphorylase / glucosamine-1-phosphate N-acetyltransferase / galactosamine-1-phosphate N-acetyltransferase
MKQAVILAAGEGRRLRPFTLNKPKGMLFIAGRPIISYVIESLAQNGILHIVIVAGYKREVLFDYIGNGRQFGVDIEYVIQERQAGAGHALYQAKNVLKGEFLVLFGDKIINPEAISQLIPAEPPVIVVKKGKKLPQNGSLQAGGKPPNGTDKNIQLNEAMINAGIFAFNDEIFHFLENENNISNAITKMIKEGVSVALLDAAMPWLDVIYPWDILSLNADVMQNITSVQNGKIESGVTLRGKVFIGKGSVVRSGSYIQGPVSIGEGCEIGPNVCILPVSCISNNVIISPFTEISNSIIGEDVHIRSGATIQDSIVDRGCSIGSHYSAVSELTTLNVNGASHNVKIGAMVGECCNIGNSVIALPGAIVGSHCKINSMKIITGIIPDTSLVC